MLTSEAQNALEAQSLVLIRSSWVGTFVRSERKRAWLAKECAEAIAAEAKSNTYMTCTGVVRNAMHCAATSRIKGRNRDAAVCTAFNESAAADDRVGDFIILPIILTTVIGWLVWRLLDLMFPLN